MMNLCLNFIKQKYDRVITFITDIMKHAVKLSVLLKIDLTIRVAILFYNHVPTNSWLVWFLFHWYYGYKNN